MDILQTIWNWYGAIVVLAALVLIVISIWDIQRERYEQQRSDYLDALYQDIWNGKDEDRITAWFRVIEHLKQWNCDEELIRRATYRMNRLKKERSSRSWIDTNGRLIETTEIK